MLLYCKFIYLLKICAHILSSLEQNKCALQKHFYENIFVTYLTFCLGNKSHSKVVQMYTYLCLIILNYVSSYFFGPICKYYKCIHNCGWCSLTTSLSTCCLVWCMASVGGVHHLPLPPAHRGQLLSQLLHLHIQTCKERVFFSRRPF